MREACTISEAVGCRRDMAGVEARRREPEALASAKLWVQRGERSQEALARLAGGRSRVGLGCAIL